MSKLIVWLGLIGLILMLCATMAFADNNEWRNLHFRNANVEVSLDVNETWMNELGHTWGDIQAAVHANNPGRVEIDSDTFPELNVPALVTFTGTCYESTPVLYHNGMPIPNLEVSEWGLCEYTATIPYWSYWELVESTWTGGTHYNTTTDSMGLGLALGLDARGIFHFNEDVAEPVDSSLYEIDLDNSGGAVWVAQDVWGGAYMFDGVSQHLEVNETTHMNFGTEDFSLSVWFKFNTTPSGNQNIISKGGSGADGYGIVLAGTSKVAARIRGAGGINQVCAQPNALNPQQWYHAAAVYDRDMNIKLYIDGQLVKTCAYLANNNESVDNANALHIGSYSTGTVEFFNGTIDEVMVFGQALNETQVTEIYNESVYYVESEIDLLYEFDDNGTQISDYVGSRDGIRRNGIDYIEGQYQRNALLCNASNSEYVEIVDDDYWDLEDGESMSIALWINTNDTAGKIIANTNGASPQWKLEMSTEEARFVISDGVDTTFTHSTTHINDSQWHHIALSMDFDTQYTKIYIDGVLEDSDNNSAINGMNTTGALSICRLGSHNSNYLNGYIDSLQMYKGYGLTQEDVSNIYNSSRDDYNLVYTNGYYQTQVYNATEEFEPEVEQNFWLSSMLPTYTGIESIWIRADECSNITLGTFTQGTFNGTHYTYPNSPGLCADFQIHLNGTGTNQTFYANMTTESFGIVTPSCDSITVLPNDINVTSDVDASSTFLLNDTDEGNMVFKMYINGVLADTFTVLSLLNGSNASHSYDISTYSIVAGDNVSWDVAPVTVTDYGNAIGSLCLSATFEIQNMDFNIDSYLPAIGNVSILKPNFHTFNITLDDVDGDAECTWWIDGLEQEEDNDNQEDFVFRSTDRINGDHSLEVQCADENFTETQSWDISVEEEDLTLTSIIAICFIAFFLLYFAFNLPKEHYLLQLMLIFVALIVVILIPSLISNGYTAIKLPITKLTTWLFYFFILYVGVYFVYRWTKQSERFIGWLKGRK